MQLVSHLWRDDRGQTFTEYSMIIALISLGMVVALGMFRDQLENVYSSLTSTVETVEPA